MVILGYVWKLFVSRLVLGSDHAMSYEIIAIENGDVLDRLSDRDEAAEALCSYVESHRASVPGVEDRVGLLELDDSDEPTGRIAMYSDLVRRAAHA